MSKTNTEQQAQTQPQVKRLSPELNEFLHMLNALEGQLSDKSTRVLSNR